MLIADLGRPPCSASPSGCSGSTRRDWLYMPIYMRVRRVPRSSSCPSSPPGSQRLGVGVGVAVHRADRRRWRALHARRRRLRRPAAQPVAALLRLPRGVPLASRSSRSSRTTSASRSRRTPCAERSSRVTMRPRSRNKSAALPRHTPGMAEKNCHSLNYPTVVAGAVAAATATALSSQLGLLGTILGAAIASIVSAVVTNALGGWIAHLHGATRDRDPLPFQRLAGRCRRDRAGGARVPHRSRPGHPRRPRRQLRRAADGADRAALIAPPASTLVRRSPRPS